MRRLAITCLVLASGMAACATSPTGRKQLMFMPESQMTQLGAASFQEIKKQMKPSSDAQMNATTQCVAQAIIKALNEKQGGGAQWEIVVFDEESPNAFALPGNKIGVHTGMFKIAKTPDQLAAVIGHEVGHVIARHGNERISTAFAAQGGLAAASVATGAALGEDSTRRGLILAALGAGAQLGVMLPYSRKQESEADEIGIDLMARAGFDPAASVQLWQNMAQAGGAQPPEFMSTHPSHQSRIEALQAMVPRAQGVYRQALASGDQPSCPRG